MPNGYGSKCGDLKIVMRSGFVDTLWLWHQVVRDPRYPQVTSGKTHFGKGTLSVCTIKMKSLLPFKKNYLFFSCLYLKPFGINEFESFTVCGLSWLSKFNFLSVTLQFEARCWPAGLHYSEGLKVSPVSALKNKSLAFVLNSSLSPLSFTGTSLQLGWWSEWKKRFGNGSSIQ